MLILSGHDTNLSNLSGVLGLSWRLPGYQLDDTPPGGALVFALWRDPASQDPIVRMTYVAQTPNQMHDASALTLASPPASVDVHLPQCRSAERAGGCPWPVFERLAAAAIDPQAVVR